MEIQQRTRTTFTEVSGAGSLVHVCELILALQTFMVTMMVETFLAWTPVLRLGKLRQKLPRPSPRLRIHQSHPEPRHRLLLLPLLTARRTRTTHACRPRSLSPLTQKLPPPPPQSQRRTVLGLPPTLMHSHMRTRTRMHPRMETSTAYRIRRPRLARAQIRIPLSSSSKSKRKRKRSAGLMHCRRAPGRSTRFLLILMERLRALQLVRLRLAGLKRYLLSRPFGLRK